MDFPDLPRGARFPDMPHDMPLPSGLQSAEALARPMGRFQNDENGPMVMTGSTALVTGATGFVGSHVAQLLASRGENLRVLVRAGSRRENLAGLPAERTEIVVGDLTVQSS